jgi:hypothetical protein
MTVQTRLRMAMVALSEARLPPAEKLRELYAKHWPDQPALVLEESDPSAETLRFRTPTIHFTVALMPKAIPWSELSGPAETAWHWPEAEARLKPHRAHLLVSAGSDTPDVVELMLALTRVVAAAALSAQAVGIYWGGATQVHDVEAFVHEARTASREQLPLYLWLRFGLVGEDDGTTSLHTTGLAELEHMEIEFPHSAFDPQTLVDRAFNIAHYLLDKGPVLEHGHTIGISAAERIAISHGPSMFDPARRVYSLTLSSTAPRVLS